MTSILYLSTYSISQLCLLQFTTITPGVPPVTALLYLLLSQSLVGNHLVFNYPNFGIHHYNKISLTYYYPIIKFFFCVYSSPTVLITINNCINPIIPSLALSGLMYMFFISIYSLHWAPCVVALRARWTPSIIIFEVK